MHLPYTEAPQDAFMAAQCALGATLTALVWHRPLRPLSASVALVTAIWLAILAPIAPELARFVGATLPKKHVVLTCNLAAALGTLAMAINKPRRLAAIAFAGQLALVWIGGFIKDSDNEFASLHVIWFAVLFGAHLRANFSHERSSEPIAPARSYLRTDLTLFFASVALAIAVGYFVLERGTIDSADEWAYNFQALVYARFKAWVPEPPCAESHRNHWVFFYQGRAFSMYLPGWPLVMAPFARAGVAWLASPISFGALVVGASRVARRVRGESAGIIAAVALMGGVATLLNAGSRYCHIFVAALFVWTIEAVCVATTPTLSRKGQWGWGLLIGATTAFALCTRPSDAAVLNSGVFLYFVYELIRRRISFRTVFGAAITFSIICGLTAILLRLQLGVWFKTGYSIADQYYYWAKTVFNVPPRDAWKYGLPLMTFTYCFWPASPALAAAGLTFVGRRVAFMLTLATLGHLAIYTAVTFGRYKDFGYGPRYHLPLIVTMAIGTGVLLAPLLDALRARAIPKGRETGFGTLVRGRWLGREQAPAALALAALILGVARIAPLMYPHAHTLLHARSAIFRAIEREHLNNAIVVVSAGQVNGGPLLDTQNDPLDPNPRVLVLSADDWALGCLRREYPNRTIYRARGNDEVTLTPLQ